MNKGELIEAVASATGSTKAEAGRAIDATVAAVTGA
ncbi:MAG: DNA-binding protein HU, partial [Nitrosomonadales bacterium]|nr:DNA-binding protein HU [Nitrosomonadales bacterium]